MERTCGGVGEVTRGFERGQQSMENVTSGSGKNNSRAASETPSASSPHNAYRILTIPNLKELQEKDDKSRVSLSQSLWKYYNNDLYTDFEKQVLQLKPSDCSIIQKYSQIETFPLEGNDHMTEITLATIYSDHPLREYHKRSMKELESTDLPGLKKAQAQLTKIDTLPLLVFIHGLGGQLSQFEPVLQEFRNCSDIFGIDLPGFGNSKRPSRNDESKGVHFSRLSTFEEKELNKLESSLNQMRNEDFQTDNLVDMISQILVNKFPSRRYLFIAHSMGTHLSLKLINKLPEGKVDSLIMMSPPRINPNESGIGPQVMNRIPWKNRLFLRSCTFFPRLFDYFRFFDRYGGLYSKSVESYIYPEEGDILKRLTQFRWNLDTDSVIFLKYLIGFSCVQQSELISAAKRLNTKATFLCCGDYDKVTKIGDSTEIYEILRGVEDFKIKFETISNSNHSLFLDKPNLLAGVTYKFVEELDLNISCTWVLQVKAIISGDKWGLKNQAKWNKVITLSKPIINGTSKDKPRSYLLGMKTLRQTDEVHNPKNFEKIHPEIYAVIDIGSDTPSYDPAEFGRIKYVKYKTESKVTPDDVTIVKFLETMDELLRERDNEEQFVVVHCHYGQNRTGFLICCYLIEKLGWSVNEAIDAFEVSKPPGIKHVHFKNALHLRYHE